MIPIYFEPLTVNFSTNGNGRLVDTISCLVTEERNGIYECEFTYPITGRFYTQLLNGGTIAVTHDDKGDVQAFDIYRHSAPINGIVTFNARHISYRLAKIGVKPFSATSAISALQGLLTNATQSTPFSVWTDVTTAGNFSNDVPANVRTLLGGVEGSILDVFGGEYEFDNFTVKLHASRGSATQVTIRHGKNLSNITKEYDEGTVATIVFPYWLGSEGNLVTLPELILSSTNVPTDTYVWTTDTGAVIDDGNDPIEFNTFLPSVMPLDLSGNFTEEPDEDDLRAAALSYLNSNKPWIPNENISVDFVALWQTPEYENVAALQRVGLCDTVSVYYPELGVVQEHQKVIKTVYNVLLDRFDSIELGHVQSTLGETITRGLADKLNATATVSMLRDTVQHATELISGGLGGHVVFNLNDDGQPQEILIMDTDDMMTAVNVIRMNKNGIGFSTNGYNGPFTSAWTIDGSFNADFIATGHLLANFIQGGTLSLGGLNNGNGVLQVYDASGNLIGSWTKDGTVTKSLTANDYLYVDGNSQSYLKVPFSTSAYFELSQQAFSIAYNPENKIYNDSILYGSAKPNTPGGVLLNCLLNSYKASTEWWSSRWDPAALYMRKSTGGGNSWTSVCSTYFYPGELHSAYGSNYFDFDGVTGECNVGAAFRVQGTKSRLVKTEDYSERLLYCYETPTPMFGDIGSGKLGEDGACYVWLDPIFAQTISKYEYQVFLQKYGDGDCWVRERKPGYFVVTGTPGLAFGWELKAKQAGYDQLRLDKKDQFRVSTFDYGNDAADYIFKLKEERIA